MIDNTKMKAHQLLDRLIDLRYTSVCQMFEAKLRENENKTLFIFPGQIERSYTYIEFYDAFLGMAKFLNSRKIEKGSKVCIVYYNTPEFVILYFACLYLGLVVVPINPDLSPREMEYIIRNSEAKYAIYDKLIKDKFTDLVLNGNPIELINYNLKENDDFPGSQEYAGGDLPDSNVDIYDEAVIIYTSGTTGNPKGVVLTHLNLLADAKAVSEWFQFDSDTRTLCILPLFHNNGQVVTMLAPLFAGGSSVFVKVQVGLLSFWDMIHKYQVEWTSVMASILSILLSVRNERKDNSLKGIICGGQILTQNVQQNFENRFDVPIFEGFGLTETTSFSCFNEYPKERRIIGSIGKALSTNDIMIMDNDGNSVPHNEVGEICIRGYNVSNEYFKLNDLNVESFKHGWFHTKDYGYIDPDGNIYFKGRQDFLIIKGGENIYPAEIENVLYLHESVAEAAVIGIPDNLLGQNICAFVHVKDEQKITKDEIMNICRENLGKFKIPSEIYLINELEGLDVIPKGPTKKILYNKLLEFWENNLKKIRG